MGREPKLASACITTNGQHCGIVVETNKALCWNPRDRRPKNSNHKRTKAPCSLMRSTGTHQRCGEARQRPPTRPGRTLETTQQLSPNPPAGAAVAPASPDRQAACPKGMRGRPEPDWQSGFVETSAHRVAAQAPHRPPTRSLKLTGGATPNTELALGRQSAERRSGGKETGAFAGHRAHPTAPHCHSSATGRSHASK